MAGFSRYPRKKILDQLLGRPEEWGGTVTAGSRGYVAGYLPARMPDRQANRLEKQRGNAPGGQNARRRTLFKGKSTRKFHAQRGEARPQDGSGPAVKAARQPVKTPQAIRTTKQQAAHAAKTGSRAGKAGGRLLHNKRRQSRRGRTIANIIRTCIAAVKNLVAALAAGGGLTLFVVLLICLIALVAGSAFGIFFFVEPTGKGMTMKQAVQTLERRILPELKEIEAETPHDQVEDISEGGSVSIH